jgi:transcriptional regulator MraZ
MLIGKYYHKLESKGRVSLPKKFRSQAKKWIVTRGLDGCLFLFKEEDFQQEISKLQARTFTKKANRDFIRLMTNEAASLDPDKNGRVHLPEYLTQFAKLSDDLVVVGSFNKIEIWDRDTYHKYIDQIEDKAENIAERIDG